jgi:hypothetical protein
LLLGFSSPRVAAFGCAAAVAVAALFVGGPMALVVSGVVWAPLATAVFVRVAGRPAVEWAATAAHFGARKATGQVEFRARVEKPRPAGTLALPGDAASMRLHVDEGSGAAMVHDPHRETLSAVLSVSHPAFALLDDPDRSQRVSRWGRVLAQLAQSGTCAGVQVLEATIPDPARSQSEWWETHGSNDGGWAATQYTALLDQVPWRSTFAPPPGRSRQPAAACGGQPRCCEVTWHLSPTLSARLACALSDGSARRSSLPSSAKPSTQSWRSTSPRTRPPT